MLPGSLVSVYQQYKEDTNAVASWLASSAKACGYSADLLAGRDSAQGSSQQQATRSKRQKGKARTKAAAAGSSATPAGPKYTIAIKDFIPLAEFVAASAKPLISVPLAFIKTLNRVISARSRFGERLGQLGAEVSSESDFRHLYFVGILEKVRDVLKPRTSPETQDAAQPEGPSTPLGDLGGRFAKLHVYEPSEEFLNAPAIERPTPVKDDNATYEAEPQTDLEDAIFAYALMLDDLDKIRAQVGWIWKRCRDGLLDLAAAAVATNTACDLARNLTEEVVPMFKAHGGVAEVAKKFYLIQCLINGHSLASMLSPPSDNFNHDTYDMAHDTYMIPFIMLGSFLLVLQPGRVPLYLEGTFGVYDPSRDLSTMSNQDKFRQDKVVLMEFFTELMVVERVVKGFPVEDEFLRGMKELDRTREVPMYLAFAAQMFLDMHHILRAKVTAAHSTCTSQLEVMDESLRLHLDFHKDLKIDHWPQSNDTAILQLISHIGGHLRDKVHDAKVKVYTGMGLSTASMPRHRLTKYSPVIAGLILYHFRMRTYEMGIAVTNAWGSTTCPLHLYSAMMQEKLIATTDSPDDHWRDMDAVLGIKGYANFFVGGAPPKNPQDYLDKFSLQMGTTAAALMKGKNRKNMRNHTLHSKSGPRGIKDGLPVSNMFTDRYVHQTGQIDWTPEHVDNVVSRSLHRDEWSQDVGVTAPSSSVSGKQQAKKTAKGSQLPPDKLVKALVLSLQAETLEMAFPYLALHRSAWTVLRAVHAACDPVLRTVYDAEYMERQSQLPWVVGWIFMSAYNGDRRPLLEAAAAIKTCMRAGEGTKAVQELSKIGIEVPAEIDPATA